MSTESKKNRDAFVGKVVADPNNPPNTLMLSGYLGDSSEADHTRLYFDPQLRAYIDIPDKAILHAEEIKGDLGGHYVWVDQGAEYVYGRTTQERPRARFFEGQIMQTHAARAQAAADAQAQAQAYIPASYHYYCPPQSRQIICNSAVCPSTFGVCPSLVDGCPSALILCESQQVICASSGGWLCPSENIICNSLVCPSLTGACPSLVDGCPSALGCFDPGDIYRRRFTR